MERITAHVSTLVKWLHNEVTHAKQKAKRNAGLTAYFQRFGTRAFPQIASLRHENGRPVAEIYGYWLPMHSNQVPKQSNQVPKVTCIRLTLRLRLHLVALLHLCCCRSEGDGSMVTFNLFRPNGDYVGYSEGKRRRFRLVL